MNIKELAATPQLVEVVLDTPDLLEKYGEPITFYTYDIVKLPTYFEFFNSRSENEFTNLDRMMKKMILDSTGKPVLADNEDLPIDIAAAAINKLGEILGKSLSKSSIPTVGEPQK